MNMTAAKPPSKSRKAGEPVWELARVFPGQGYWTERDYLELDQGGNMLVEFTDGYVEVLPMPTKLHQEIVFLLVQALTTFSKPQKSGQVLFAPLPVKLRNDLWREPDIVFIMREHVTDADYPENVDVVMEVVSPDARSRQRDYVEKRRDYALGGVPEYWIVDPQKMQITVLRLKGRRYIEHGIFKKGQKATSALLPGFSVEVNAAFG